MALAQAVVVEERSLEQIADALERRQAAEEEDAEAQFVELIRDLSDIRPESMRTDEFVHHDEFVCSGCHLVLHHNRLADPSRGLCRDCDLPG